jgi:hypothetical protein
VVLAVSQQQAEPTPGQARQLALTLQQAAEQAGHTPGS